MKVLTPFLKSSLLQILSDDPQVFTCSSYIVLVSSTNSSKSYITVNDGKNSIDGYLNEDTISEIKKEYSSVKSVAGMRGHILKLKKLIFTTHNQYSSNADINKVFCIQIEELELIDLSGCDEPPLTEINDDSDIQNILKGYSLPLICRSLTVRQGLKPINHFGAFFFNQFPILFSDCIDNSTHINVENWECQPTSDSQLIHENGAVDFSPNEEGNQNTELLHESQIKNSKMKISECENTDQSQSMQYETERIEDTLDSQCKRVCRENLAQSSPKTQDKTQNMEDRCDSQNGMHCDEKETQSPSTQCEIQNMEDSSDSLHDKDDDKKAAQASSTQHQTPNVEDRCNSLCDILNNEKITQTPSIHYDSQSFEDNLVICSSAEEDSESDGDKEYPDDSMMKCSTHTPHVDIQEYPEDVVEIDKKSFANSEDQWQTQGFDSYASLNSNNRNIIIPPKNICLFEEHVDEPFNIERSSGAKNQKNNLDVVLPESDNSILSITNENETKIDSLKNPIEDGTSMDVLGQLHSLNSTTAHVCKKRIALEKDEGRKCLLKLYKNPNHNNVLEELFYIVEWTK